MKSNGKRTQFCPSSLTSTIATSANDWLGSPTGCSGFSKTMKSGPGPLMMRLFTNRRVIRPPSPRDNRSCSEKFGVFGLELPFGGPRTFPG